MAGNKYHKHRDESLYETEALYEIAYKAGVEDAWDNIKRIIQYINTAKYGTIREIFGDEWDFPYMYNLKGNDIIDLIEKYDESRIHSEVFIGDNIPELVEQVYNFIMDRNIDVLDFEFDKRVPSITISYCHPERNNKEE